MNRPLRLLVALLFAAAAVALLVALISYAPDQVVGASPTGANLVGPVGARLAHALVGAFGAAGFLPVLVLVAMAGVVASGAPWDKAARRLTGAILLLPALAGLLHLLPMWRGGERVLLHWDQLQ